YGLLRFAFELDESSLDRRANRTSSRSLRRSGLSTDHREQSVMRQDSGISTTSRDQTALARALRLLQAPDDTAGDLSDVDLQETEQFFQLIRHVHRRHQIARLTNWLPSGNRGSEPPLGP